ncbi:TonB-dependent receptor, partial [bacterium]|nr:TonB-dependent receptor [bacterium]
PGYALREAWYNRDVNLKYTSNYTRTFSPFSKLAAKFSGSYTRQNSFKQQLISRDNIVISDRLTEGSQEGRIVFGSYLGKKWIKGDVWNLYSDVNYHQIFNIGDVVNNVNLGLTWRSDFNKGEGIVFDPLFPPSLSSPTPRLRTYNDLPAYNIMSFYFEDKVAGQFWRPFTLQVGVRYEAYRPNGINIKGLWSGDDFVESHNGTFLNPRLNFAYSLGENTQLRLGYGMTSKSPPMGMIFAQEKYYDIVDTVSVVNPQYPDSNFSIISTHIRPQANPDLQGYTQSKYEASLDQRIGPMGFSITGYINNTKNSFQSYDNPTLFFKNSYPDWPNQTTSAPYDTLMDEYTQYGNNGWLNVRGVEVAFRTKRLPVINTVIKFDASYRYRESGTKDGIVYGSRRYSTDLGFYVKPVHNTTERYSKDLLLNYRFDVQARTLGIWATLHVQQKVIDINGYRGLADTLAVGYFDQYGNIVMLSEAER